MQDKKSEQTSAQQLRWAFRQLGHAVRHPWRHVSWFDLAYGFVCGVIGGIATVVAAIWYGILSYSAPRKITNLQNLAQLTFEDFIVLHFHGRNGANN